MTNSPEILNYCRKTCLEMSIKRSIIFNSRIKNSI